MFYYLDGTPKWDEYTYPEGRLNYNLILGEVITEALDVDEPVTLEEIKQHLKLADSFTEDDEYLTLLNKGARQSIENFTGLSLVPKTIEVTIDNVKGGYELPYGPVTSAITAENADGNVITSDELVYTAGLYPQTSFKSLRAYYYGGSTFTYFAGYDVTVIIPAALKLAILHEIAYLYQHRGDENNIKAVNSEVARAYGKQFKRGSWLA